LKCAWGHVAATSDEYFVIRFTAPVQHSVIRMDDFKWQEESLSVDTFETSAFSVYPNPSLDKIINLVYDAKFNANDNEVVIFSMTGQKIFQTKLKNKGSVGSQNLDLSNLNSGVYMLQFTSGNYSTTKKIILK
jgi:hypothetical protein